MQDTKKQWVEGWWEPAVAPLYGFGQEPYTLASYVLGIAVSSLPRESSF